MPSIHVDGQPVVLKSQKAEALLFYIVLSGETGFRRDYLASIFWEDRDTQLARGNLRQTLARIKKMCGSLEPAIIIGRERITVDPTLVKVDAWSQLKAIEEGTEPFDVNDTSPNIDNIFAAFEEVGPTFQSWVSVFRNTLERKYNETLSAVLTQHPRPNRATRMGAARMLLRVDPTNEAACRFLMTEHAEAGEQAEALRIYNDLYNLLDEEYDVEPTDDTVQLNATIKMGQVVRSPKVDEPTAWSSNSEPHDAPRIFVNTFETDETNPETLRLGRFFRAEILTNLSRFREWNVVDAEPLQAAYYKLDCNIEDFRGDLNVILSVRRYPERVVVWSERFEAVFDNWRQTQWRISQQLALAMNQSITSDRLKTSLTTPPEARSVFDKWVFSKSLTADWSPEHSQIVEANLMEITESAPDFGLAHAWLASMHNTHHISHPGVFRSRESVTAALKYARSAMELDPLDAHNHRAIAWAHLLNENFDVAEFHFQQSLTQNPMNLLVRVSAALGFAFLGRLDQATAIADETRELDSPLMGFHWGYLQNVYYLAGRLEDAKAAGNFAGSTILNLPAWQAAILHELGETEAARGYLNDFFELTRQNWQGKPDPSDDDMLEWLIHCFPIRDKAQRLRLEKAFHLR